MGVGANRPTWSLWLQRSRRLGGGCGRSRQQAHNRAASVQATGINPTIGLYLSRQLLLTKPDSAIRCTSASDCVPKSAATAPQRVRLSKHSSWCASLLHGKVSELDSHGQSRAQFAAGAGGDGCAAAR
jgi:hypothetical protein